MNIKSELPIELILTLSHPVTPYALRRARRRRRTLAAIVATLCAMATACTMF